MRSEFFHEIHHRGAVLVDERLPRAPEQQLCQAHDIAVVEERLGNTAQLRIERERHHKRNQIGFLLGEHGAHGRQWRLDHDIVALLLEPHPAQHAAHRDIDGRAAGIDRHHATLHVFEALHGPVGEHHIFLRVVVLHAVLEFISDDPQVGEARVVNRYRQCREGEVCNFKLVVCERRDHLRRSGVADRFEDVGPPHVPGEFLFLHEQRRPVRKRRDPGYADLDRLSLRCARRLKQNCCNESNKPRPYQPHVFLPRGAARELR